MLDSNISEALLSQVNLGRIVVRGKQIDVEEVFFLKRSMWRYSDDKLISIVLAKLRLVHSHVKVDCSALMLLWR